jgi:hypothetical protein
VRVETLYPDRKTESLITFNGALIGIIQIRNILNPRGSPSDATPFDLNQQGKALWFWLKASAAKKKAAQGQPQEGNGHFYSGSASSRAGFQIARRWR